MDRKLIQIVAADDAFDFDHSYGDLLRAIDGISERKIAAYFNSKAIGAKSKSLASTVRALVTNDLQLNGWVMNWKPFQGPGLETALWSFDVAKKIQIAGKTCWITAEISFDNRVAVGTHLSKASVANNEHFRKLHDNFPIVHHCIVAATADFKLNAGIDGSVASSEEFEAAAGPYSKIISVPTTLVALLGLLSLELEQKKTDGRLRSKVTIAENLDS